MAKYDDLHLDLREIEGYNCTWNVVISEREPGKTTAMWRKARKNFEEGNTFLLTRQHIKSLSAIYIHDCFEVINKFIDDDEERYDPLYSKSAMANGVFDVYARKRKEGAKERLMFRAVALNVSMSDTKSLFLKNCKFHMMDEFIKDTRHGESYLKGETFRFKELINTFQRESPGPFKSYLFGNPYSRANPYFVELGVDINKLKRGEIYVDRVHSVCIQCYEMKPELRALILERNPLYKFSDEYTKYAFDGLSINDIHMITINKRPLNFSLLFAVRMDGKILGIYQSNKDLNFDYSFWVGPVDKLGQNRLTYAFDFSDLRHNTILIDKYGKHLLNNFANAMRCRKVAFANSQYGTWAETIYNYL